MQKAAVNGSQALRICGVAFALVLAMSLTAVLPGAAQAQIVDEMPLRAIVGLPVYSSDGENIGTVSDLASNDGRLVAIVEMPAFLGFGARSVMIDAASFVQKVDRIELALTGRAVRASLSRIPLQ